jgi:hypothetical protein
MNKKTKLNYTYFLVLLFLMIHFKLFENVYVVYRSNLSERLTTNYGYCEKNSYGFIKYIEKKYKFNRNISILNDEIHPNSQAFIYKPKKEYDPNFAILLNYNKENSIININNYTIIDQYKNCFYLKKND